MGSNTFFFFFFFFYLNLLVLIRTLDILDRLFLINLSLIFCVLLLHNPIMMVDNSFSVIVFILLISQSSKIKILRRYANLYSFLNYCYFLVLQNYHKVLKGITKVHKIKIIETLCVYEALLQNLDYLNLIQAKRLL